MTLIGFPLRVLAATALAVGLGASAASAQATQTMRQTPPPAPKPFPQPGTPATSGTVNKPLSPATAAQAPLPPPSGTPTEASLGVQIYPNAEFVGSYDGGRGQRIYLYGTNSAYLDVVGYYKTVMKTGGREIFKAPATQEFDLPGIKWVEETMALVPGIVVKDYTWDGSSGYLVVDGTSEKRFKTIIQIVPATVR